MQMCVYQLLDVLQVTVRSYKLKFLPIYTYICNNQKKQK